MIEKILFILLLLLINQYFQNLFFSILISFGIIILFKYSGYFCIIRRLLVIKIKSDSTIN